MAVGSVFQTGVNGVRDGLNSARQAADNIAKIGTVEPRSEQGATGDLAEQIVNLKVSENQVKASAKVIETADEMLGTLIDTRA